MQMSQMDTEHGPCGDETWKFGNATFIGGRGTVLVFRLRFTYSRRIRCESSSLHSMYRGETVSSARDRWPCGPRRVLIILSKQLDDYGSRETHLSPIESRF